MWEATNKCGGAALDEEGARLRMVTSEGGSQREILTELAGRKNRRKAAEKKKKAKSEFRASFYGGSARTASVRWSIREAQRARAVQHGAYIHSLRPSLSLTTSQTRSAYYYLHTLVKTPHERSRSPFETRSIKRHSYSYQQSRRGTCINSADSQVLARGGAALLRITCASPRSHTKTRD